MPATSATKAKDSTAFVAMKTPEELQAASEKLMNFWVGAATPLWLPFMAATSFGIGTWALTQAMQRQQELLKDMPLGGGLGGGLSSFWLGHERASEALAVTEIRLAKEAEIKTESLAEATVAAFSNPQEAVTKAATAMMNESIELASKTIESVTVAVEAASKPVKAALKAAPKAKPVVAKSVAVKSASVEPEAIKAAVKTADKLAEAMSDMPKPASRRRPARKA